MLINELGTISQGSSISDDSSEALRISDGDAASQSLNNKLSKFMTKNATLGSKRLAPYGSFRIKKEDKNKQLQASDMPDI